MTKIEDVFWGAVTLIGGLAGIGLFFTAIAAFSGFIICVAGKAC
jgi:hypothetical protein